MGTVLAFLALILLGVLVTYAAALTWSVVSGYLQSRRRARLEEEWLGERIRLLRQEIGLDEQKREYFWSGFRKFTVHKKVPEVEHVCSFYLVPHDGKPLPPFRPGQYLTFRLHIPGEKQPTVRCYSLSDSASRTDYYRVTIKKILPPPGAAEARPGLASSYFHDQLREGDIVDVKAPAGQFWLDMSQPHPVVLLAGGIGITPLLSMLNTVIDSGLRRDVWFFYGIRNGSEYVMKEHLEKFARGARERVRLHVCFASPAEGDLKGNGTYHAERVSVDLLKRVLPLNNFDFYLCGPPPMMQALTDGLTSWGVPEAKIHYEAFGPATVKKVKLKEESAEAAQAAAPPVFTVAFAKSGKQCRWTASQGPLLDLAEANGVHIDFGCRAGNCGTCLTAVKSGNVAYLSDHGAISEEGSCLTCVAVPKSDLVLDA